MQRNICKHGRALLPWRIFQLKKDLRLHPTQENAACVEMWRCSAPFSVDFLSPPPYPSPSPRSSFTIIAFTREGMRKKKKNCISSAVPEGKSWDPCLVYSQQEKERTLHPAVTGVERSRFAVLFSPFLLCTHPVFPLSKVGRLKLPPFLTVLFDEGKEAPLTSS